MRTAVAGQASVDPLRVRTSLGQPVQVSSLQGVCPMRRDVGPGGSLDLGLLLTTTCITGMPRMKCRAQHHCMPARLFVYNYGHLFMYWDKLLGTYRPLARKLALSREQLGGPGTRAASGVSSSTRTLVTPSLDGLPRACSEDV